MTDVQLTKDQSFTGVAYTDPGYKIPITREYMTEEVGQSGVKNYSGFLDTDEWVADLKGLPLYQTIDYMRNDAIIAALERGFFLPIEQSQVHFEYDDKTLNDDPHYKFIIDFIQKDFSNINMPAFLHNANLAIPYGFSCFEQIYKVKEDGYLHLNRLAPRLPKTAWKWLIDGNGNLVTFIQYTYTPEANGSAGEWKFIPIPAEKLLLITHQKEGGNFVGRSEYRPFYREWKIKDAILKQMIITISRVGGGVLLARINNAAPDATASTTGGTATENLGAQQQIEKVLQKLQASENSYIAAKWLDELKMFGLDPNALREMRDTVRHLDESIAKAGFQMFMALGTSETGSRNLGETFSELYYMGLEGKSAITTGAINEQVIKRLIDYNFGVQESYPKMKIDIQRDMGTVYKMMGVLKRNGLIRGNQDTENFIMDYYGMPITTAENEMETAPITPLEQTATVESTQMTDKHAHNDHIEDILEMVDVKVRRNPKRNAMGRMDFEKHASEINAIKKSLAMELRHICEPAIIQAGKDLVNGVKPYELKMNWGNKVSDLWKKYFKRLAEKGRMDVRAELSKQKLKLSDKIKMADIPIKKPVSQKWDEYVMEQSNIESEYLDGESKSAAMEYYSAGKKMNLTGDALTAFIIDGVMSEKGQRYDSNANDIVSVYGQVREMGAEEFQDIIKSKIRTEIFDKNICDECARQDGAEYLKAEDGEYYGTDGELAPDPPFMDCEGGENCRGLYLYGID